MLLVSLVLVLVVLLVQLVLVLVVLLEIFGTVAVVACYAPAIFPYARSMKRVDTSRLALAIPSNNAAALTAPRRIHSVLTTRTQLVGQA